jgi:hypothetical protein
MAKRKKKTSSAQMSFLENYGKTAPAVPAIREAIKVIDILGNDTTKSGVVEVK